MKTKNEKTVSTVENSVMNFDFLKSLDVEKFKSEKSSSKVGASEIYKINQDFSETERKTARRKLKRQRDNLIADLMNAATDLKKNQNSKENQENFKIAAKNFKEFYLKNYLLNDFSVESICSSNSKQKNRLKTALDIIKNV